MRGETATSAQGFVATVWLRVDFTTASYKIVGQAHTIAVARTRIDQACALKLSRLNDNGYMRVAQRRRVQHTKGKLCGSDEPAKHPHTTHQYNVAFTQRGLDIFPVVENVVLGGQKHGIDGATVNHVHHSTQQCIAADTGHAVLEQRERLLGK